MGKGAVLALRSVQWFNRAIQFGSAALVLGVYVYFIAIMGKHNLDIPTDAKAVAGISGIAVAYTALGMALLCCLSGHTFFSFLAMVLDFCFIGSFIYVAVQNKNGAGSCNGQVNTIFGSGNADTNVANGSVVDPSVNLHLACKLETACLAVSIIAIVFFIFSMLTELFLARLRKKEQRIGPSPANNYTSGYGSATAGPRRGFFGRLFRRRAAADADGDKLMVSHDGPNKEGVVESTDAEAYRMNTPYGVATETQPTAAAYGATGAGAAAANKYAPENYGVNNTGGAAYAGEDTYGAAAPGSITSSLRPSQFRADNPYRS